MPPWLVERDVLQDLLQLAGFLLTPYQFVTDDVRLEV